MSRTSTMLSASEGQRIGEAQIVEPQTSGDTEKCTAEV
jgi:hypothetical protein